MYSRLKPQMFEQPSLVLGTKRLERVAGVSPSVTMLPNLHLSMHPVWPPHTAF